MKLARGLLLDIMSVIGLWTLFTAFDDTTIFSFLKNKLYFVFYNLGIKLQKTGYYCWVSVSNKKLSE